MDQIKNMLSLLSDKLRQVAHGNAVVAKPISMGERHVVPLVELSLALGGGGGEGEEESSGRGTGGGAGGGVKATPVAVLVVDHGKARLEVLG
jgi:uncharacterized spore protein YtfJ